MQNLIELNRERKIILIVGAILLILGAIYRFSPGIISAVSASDEIEMKKNHLAKYLRIAAQRDRSVDENVYFKRTLNQMESRLLKGKTPTLAAVEIQDILNGIGQLGNVNFMSMQVMKPEEGEDSEYIRLPVRFSMNADIVQLKDIIYQIEASSKLLVISELDAKVARSRDGYLIRSTITVEGVMRTPQPAG